MSQQRTEGNFGLLGIIGVILTLGVVYFTWPFCLLYIGMTVAYYYTKNQKNIFLEASNKVIAPVTVGLAVFMTILLVVNLFNFMSPNSLRVFEQWMADLRLSTKSWLNISTIQFLIIIGVLLVITMFLPRLQAVSRFMKAYKVVQYSTIALATITSFTFFSQMPADGFIKAEHAQNVKRYEILVKEGNQQIGEYIAAKAIQEKIENLSKSEIQTFRAIFDSIQVEHLRHSLNNYSSSSTTYYRYKDSRKEVTSSIATTFAQQADHAKTIIEVEPSEGGERQAAEEVFIEGAKALQEAVASSENSEQNIEVPDFRAVEELIMKNPPNTIEEKEQQLEVIVKREKINKDIKLRTQEIFKAIETTFIHTIGIKGTDIQNLGETFIKKVVQEYSTRMFKTNIAKNLNFEGNVERVVEVVSRARFSGDFFAPGWIMGSYRSNRSYSSGLAVRNKFDKTIRNQQSVARKNYYSRLSSRSSSGYGSGRSTRSYGG